MTDRYSYWRASLAGQAHPIHEGLAGCGFFYLRRKDGTRTPVAIFEKDGEVVARVGFDSSARLQSPADTAEVWNYCCKNPISEELYRAAASTGVWPDDPPPAVPAAANAATSDGEARPNAPASDDPAEAIRLELLGEEEQAREFLAKPIETKADADRAAVWSKRIGGLGKRAEVQHKAEKQPHLDAGRAVDARYKPLVDKAKDLSDQLKRHIEPFLIAQRRKEDAERQKAADEAKRLREEADAKANEAAQAALHGTVEDKERAEAARMLALRGAQTAERAAEPKGTNAGRTGAKVALRTETRARVTDFDALLMALKDAPEVRTLVDQLANRAARAGTALPGMEIETYERAA